MDSIGLVTSWDNQTKLNFWKSNSNQNDSCNSLNGTDASVFHPNVKKNETLRIFNRYVHKIFNKFTLLFHKKFYRDLCRSIPLKFINEFNDAVKGSEGILTYR